MQDIFLHVNQVGIQTLFGMCTDAQRMNKNPEDAICAMGLAYLRFAEDHTHQFDLMFSRQDQNTVVQQSPISLSSQISSLFDLVENELRQLNTTADDEGFYIVQPQLKSGTSQTHPIIPTGGVDFGVIVPGNIWILEGRLRGIN